MADKTCKMTVNVGFIFLSNVFCQQLRLSSNSGRQSEAATCSELECMALAPQQKWTTRAVASSLRERPRGGSCTRPPATGSMALLATIVSLRRSSRRHVRLRAHQTSGVKGPRRGWFEPRNRK